MSLKSDELNKKCRCCLNPSVNFIQLDSSTKTSEGIERTYQEMLYEVTNLNVPAYLEYSMPQHICHKCGNHLKSSYKFIQQAYQVSQQYLQIANDQQQISPADIKNIEPLQESLIELQEYLHDTKCQEEIKIEPLITEECNKDIKQEIQDNELLTAVNPIKEESQANREVLEKYNTDNSSDSDDQNESDDPESLEGNDDFLKNEPLARRCDICHKIYRDEKFLNIHKRYTHMPEEDKIPCPLCSYRTNRTGNLKVHIGLIHGQDKVEEYFKSTLKSHTCNLCPRSYTRKDTLQRHMRRKHLNKFLITTAEEEFTKEPNSSIAKEKQRFLCTYCGQSFTSKPGLESHNLTHNDNRPYSCDICDKTFKRPKNLQLHRLIHSDEKPHKCLECGKSFKRVDKLKIHMRVHSELRPYKCSECEKTFKYQSVLRTHMHIHTGQTPYACKTCGEAFSLITSLNNHCLKNGHDK